MTVQIALRLDEDLAARAREAAAAEDVTLSEWLRRAIRTQTAVAKARRARIEEDAREPLYTAEQEAALMAARHRRAIAAFDER